MARAIRYVSNGHYYFLTNRCLLGQFLMLPDDECRRIIKGCLARAAEAHDVELVCFVFLSNHFHLIARFPKLNMSEFMEQLQGQIAERLNKLRGRSGPVFPKRFDDQALLDEQVLRDKIAYLLNNPVQDRLVRSAEDWPGVTSMKLHYNDEPLEGSWLNHTKWRKYRRRKNSDKGRDDAFEEHQVELHYPASLDGEIRDERRQSLIELVEDHRNDLHSTWSTAPHRGGSAVGAEAILEDFDWWNRPEQPPDSSGRRLLGVGIEPGRISEYRQKRREISEAYRRASNAWPDCKKEDFPYGTYPPSCRRCIGFEHAT